MTWSGPTRPKVNGIQDLNLQLSGLAATVSQIVVQAADGFEWATEPFPTPPGPRTAKFFPSATSGQGDLYINPQVKSDLATLGTKLPLGEVQRETDPVSQWR